jgi:glutamate transport system substrate-binding protein
MNRHLIAIATVTLTAGAILSACTSAQPPLPAPARIASAKPTSVTAAKCISSSAVVVGVKADQYGTGYLDVRNYSYSGFDVDVASYISGELFNATPVFLPVSSDTREPVLSSCAIRFFAATYTITPQRQRLFDLAGPYLVTYQGVMVRSGRRSPHIATLSDLDGKQVCVVGGGSQAEQVLEDSVPGVIPKVVGTYSTCLAQLRDGYVDAFSTDLAILYGYLTDPANAGLQIVKGLTIGNPIYYGIAFRKSDHALCLQAAAAIAEMITSKVWQTDIEADLPDYVADQALYPEPLQPTGQEITDNSCVTPPPS